MRRVTTSIALSAMIAMAPLMATAASHLRGIMHEWRADSRATLDMLSGRTAFDENAVRDTLRTYAASCDAVPQSLARQRVPDDEDGAFASAIRGLGLLAVTAMAMTGSVFFVTHGTSLAHTALSLHKLIANLVWVYRFAHAGVAVLPACSATGRR